MKTKLEITQVVSGLEYKGVFSLSNKNFSYTLHFGVHIEKLDSGFTVTKIEVNTLADVPGIENEAFQKFALETKSGCPISKALAVKEIVFTAKLK